MKIGCVCPTRGRPAEFRKLAESLVATSTRATILAYVDNDDRELYEKFCDWEALFPGRIRFHYGERLGMAQSVNMLTQVFRGYDVYGLLVDDSELLTPGWDEYVERTFDSFPGRLGVISANHGNQWVNFPYVSREWLDIVGWMAPPDTFHFCWDSILELLGEGTRIEYPEPSEFSIKHHALAPDHPDNVLPDELTFLNWVMFGRRATVQAIRRQIAEAVKAGV